MGIAESAKYEFFWEGKFTVAISSRSPLGGRLPIGSVFQAPGDAGALPTPKRSLQLRQSSGRVPSWGRLKPIWSACRHGADMAIQVDDRLLVTN